MIGKIDIKKLVIPGAAPASWRSNPESSDFEAETRTLDSRFHPQTARVARE
ncbi:MAG: hypothetical protein ACREP0_13650 [Rhodanobacteraceae bacterium]